MDRNSSEAARGHRRSRERRQVRAPAKKSIDDAARRGSQGSRAMAAAWWNAEEANASGRGSTRATRPRWRSTTASSAWFRTTLRHITFSSTRTRRSGIIDKALEHGEAYARLSPAIPHAAHMWGHDLRRVGRVDDAIHEFLKADTLERAYYAAEKLRPCPRLAPRAQSPTCSATCYEYKGQMRARGEEDARVRRARRRGRVRGLQPP